MTDQSPHAKPSPKVVVLSPYHNRSHGVEATVRSLASQTYRAMEAIIWDDASSDDTWDKLREVVDSAADDRIRVHRFGTNHGLTRGLNWGIAQAEGADYIAIVGSGDVCAPERIASQVAALENDPNAVFCATASATIDPVSGNVFRDEEHARGIVVRSDIEHVCPFTHGSVMYRASEVRAAGGYEEAFVWCADWDLFFRLLDRSHGIYLDQVLYRRTAQVDGASFDPEKSMLQIACKHLVLDLSTADQRSREEILSRVRSADVYAVIGPNHFGYRRDLARRNIKLYLMGRREAAGNMRVLAEERGIRYPARYRFFMQVARAVSLVPVRADVVIRLARALPR